MVIRIDFLSDFIKFAVSKNSSLAVEVLAGLASKEDFQAVQLKKAAPVSSPMLPYKPLMLLHIKGRRYVQTRLVKPVVKSVNSGDCYVLVTSKEVCEILCHRLIIIIYRSLI